MLGGASDLGQPVVWWFIIWRLVLQRSREVTLPWEGSLISLLTRCGRLTVVWGGSFSLLWWRCWWIRTAVLRIQDNCKTAWLRRTQKGKVNEVRWRQGGRKWEWGRSVAGPSFSVCVEFMCKDKRVKTRAGVTLWKKSLSQKTGC